MADYSASTPPPEDSPAVGTSAPVSATTGLPRNIAAGLASIFTLIGGIVFLVLERKDRFVRFYALQSIYLGATILLVSAAIQVVNFIFRQLPLIGSLLNGALSLANAVFSLLWFAIYVVVIIKAFTGREWLAPYLGGLAKRQAGGTLS